MQSVLDGWVIPAVPPQPELRAGLEAEAAAGGPEALHARLAALDPLAAGRIDYRNVRRVIRALEVCLVTGRPISEQQRKEPPPIGSTGLGVTRERAELYARVDARVDCMLAEGLVAEVQRLAAAGLRLGAAGHDRPGLPADRPIPARRNHAGRSGRPDQETHPAFHPPTIHLVPHR